MNRAKKKAVRLRAPTKPVEPSKKMQGRETLYSSSEESFSGIIDPSWVGAKFSFKTEKDYGCLCCEDNNVSFYAEFEVFRVGEIDNPNYDRDMIAYKKKLAHYEKKLAEYEIEKKQLAEVLSK